MLKFNKQEKENSINGALKLRNGINQIIDEIYGLGFRKICWMGIGGTYASSLQVEVHMKEKTNLDVFVENASEYLTTGNRRIDNKTLIIISSVTGSTEEMVKGIEKVKESGACILGFIDAPNTYLAEEVDYCISYPENEQLKFFMAADRFLFLNGEFENYDSYYSEMEDYLAVALASVGSQADEFAQKFVETHHDDDLHYFVGAGNQFGATYSYAMCYWEEQHWIRTRISHSSEFFHGLLEVIDRDSNVTVFVGEDSQRKLSERVAQFLPRICSRYSIIDTRNYELPGISDENRGSISHLVMREICSRIDTYMEKVNCHPMEIRRYYRRLKY